MACEDTFLPLPSSVALRQLPPSLTRASATASASCLYFPIDPPDLSPFGKMVITEGHSQGLSPRGPTSHCYLILLTWRLPLTRTSLLLQKAMPVFLKPHHVAELL